MDNIEIRLRLIEAAARTPASASNSPDEIARRVLEVAQEWETYVLPAPAAPAPEAKAARERAVLGLPK